MIRANNRLWLGISLLFACYYGICFYYFVFNQKYVVQDDVRHHIVWLQRHIDSDLFTQDIIADYFTRLAPLGFKYLYLWAAKLGIEPILLAKLLPPILAIITTIYIYLFTLQLLPIPSAGFISSLLMNQLIWLNDDLVSSTARAFIYPLFAAWLYYLSRNAVIFCLILMLLQGLFYPHIVLIEIGILSIRLITINRKTLFRLTTNKSYYIWWLAGIIVTAIALYPITRKPPELASTVTALQMQQMPEFYVGGRTPFFSGNVFKYWLNDSSGLSLPLFPTIVWAGLALPLLLNQKKYIAKLVTNKVYILLQVTIASLIMFGLAHLSLPTLHLPSRYTYHTVRFVLAISSGIVITIWTDSIKRWLRNQKQLYFATKIKLTIVTLFALTTIIFPAIPFVFINWFQGWQVGTAPAIYQYLAQQPKDIVIASLSPEVDNIPAFSQRSILVGGEFAMAYHPTYYSQFKQRTIELLQAQYSPNLLTLQSFVRQYNVNYLLLDKNAFTPKYLSNQNWLINSSWSAETQKAIAIIKSNCTPAIKQLVSDCTVVTTENLDLLEANCIMNKS